MTLGVLVVEGGEYSGSAITAKLASEYSREIFAVPGNITSKMSWGPNLLIKQGAKLIQDWSDVVAELAVEDRRQLSGRFRNQLNLKENQEPVTSGTDFSSEQTGLGAKPEAESGDPAMTAVTRSVLRALTPDSPVSLDHLIESIQGSSSSEVIAALFDLEMAGLVRQVPGKSFLRVWAD